ncbi:MAG: methyltransferase [Clostridia bacterium]|nr:methyltransferase [Clostridia bacterium]
MEQKIEILKDERIDDLQLDGLKIIQNNKYNFTSDSAILANFVAAKKTDKCVEIGSGSGVISILVNYKNNPQKITAFEIQEEIATLAKKNILFNNLQEKIEVINAPIQNFNKYIKKESVDVVFSNPPYLKVNEKSLINLEDAKAKSRHEICLTLEEFICTSSKLLKFGGKLFFIHRPDRLAEIFDALNKYKLEPKTMFFTSPSLASQPTAVLIMAQKGAKAGLKILPTLITNSESGDYLFTIRTLYKEKK